MQPVDQLWLAEYNEKDDKRRRELSGGTDIGASRSARTIKLDIDEKAESIGTGAAAVAAASAALVAKEDGRRLDALTMHSVDALKEACAVYKDICLTLKERAEILEATHIEMLHTVRSHYLHATEIESTLRRVQDEPHGDAATELLMLMAAKHFGLPLDQLRPAAAAAAAQKGKRRPPQQPPNGVPKS